MPLTLNRIGQIALAVRDVDQAEAFYRDVLRLRWLYRFGDLTFFDCSGIRLLLEKASEPEKAICSSPIYFSCADISLAVRELERRGVTFTSKPHLIAPMEDHDLWMAFFHEAASVVLPTPPFWLARTTTFTKTAFRPIQKDKRHESTIS